MGKNSRPLTDTFIKNLKPEDKAKKHYDGGGLHMLIKPSGGKYWHLDYRLGGKAKILALGVYPETTLFEARQGRESARAMLKDGKDPMDAKKEKKALAAFNNGNSFAVIAEDWLQGRTFVERHKKRTWQSFQNDILPAIGSRPITEIKPSEITALLQKVIDRGAIDAAHRVKQRIASVFHHAISKDLASYNPCNDMKTVLPGWTKRHRPAIMQEDLPEFLLKLHNDPCHERTKLGIMLVILTWLRSAELRGGKWAEIDFEKKKWVVPASRMKMKERDDHIIPLSSQALKVLERLKGLAGKSEFIFPGRNTIGRVMSENTMTNALQAMGYRNKATIHGFRATASTIVNETGLFNPDAIERQLAHCEKDSIRAAYHRAEYMEERRKMMDWYGDYIEGVSPKTEAENQA